MVEWKEIKFKQLVAEMGDGGTPDTSDPENFGVGIPWAVVEDVKPEIYETKQQLTERGFNSCSAKKWPASSIILTTGATIGNVGIAKIELCTKQGITGIVPNEHADNLFLRYWLENNTNQLLRYAQGTTFKEIRTRPLGNLRIKVPVPFTEESVKIQKKISSILYFLDRSIGQTEEVIATAERLKKALMQNLLTGKMKPDGTYRKEGEFYIDEKYGKIPKGWEVVRLSGLCSQITDGVHATPEYIKEGVPFLSVTDLRDNRISFDFCNYITLEQHKELIKRCKPEKGDILMGKVATLGVCDIIETDREFSIFVQIALLKPNPDKVHNYFLKHLISTQSFLNKLMSRAAGTTIKYIGIDSIGKLKVVIPANIDEQREIANKINEIHSFIETKKTKIQTLQRLKKSLMQNLLIGKVKVKI